MLLRMFISELWQMLTLVQHYSFRSGKNWVIIKPPDTKKWRIRVTEIFFLTSSWWLKSNVSTPVLHVFFFKENITGLYTSVLSCFKSQKIKKKKKKEEYLLVTSGKFKSSPVAKLVGVSKTSRNVWSSILNIGVSQITCLSLVCGNRNLGTGEISTFSEVTYNIMQHF